MFKRHQAEQTALGCKRFHFPGIAFPEAAKICWITEKLMDRLYTLQWAFEWNLFSSSLEVFMGMRQFGVKAGVFH